MLPISSCWGCNDSCILNVVENFCLSAAAFLVLDLGLYVCIGVAALNIECDGLFGESLNVDLLRLQMT
jgi:hypothetical protein